MNNNGMSNSGHKNMYAQQQQQQNYAQFNPFGALMGQPYMAPQPQMYAPPPYYYPPQQMQPMQQSPPHQQKSGGMFDNFIFNQLSQNANQNYGRPW